MLELEAHTKRLNYNHNFKFMPFGKWFIFMPFGNYVIWEVTSKSAYILKSVNNLRLFPQKNQQDLYKSLHYLPYSKNSQFSSLKEKIDALQALRITRTIYDWRFFDNMNPT